MSEAVGIKTIYNRVDYYFKNGATEVDKECYNSARAVMTLALAFNKDLDSNAEKYDKFFNDYPKFEAQMAKAFAKLREAYKGKNILVDAVNAQGRPITIEMDSERFFNYSVENLQQSLKERGIKFNKSLFQPKNNEKEM